MEPTSGSDREEDAVPEPKDEAVVTGELLARSFHEQLCRLAPAYGHHGFVIDASVDWIGLSPTVRLLFEEAAENAAIDLGLNDCDGGGH